MSCKATDAVQTPPGSNDLNSNLAQNPEQNPKLQREDCSPLWGNSASRIVENEPEKNQCRNNNRMNKQFYSKNHKTHNRRGNRKKFRNNDNVLFNNKNANSSDVGQKFNRKRINNGGSSDCATPNRRWNGNQRTSFPQYNDPFKHSLDEKHLNSINNDNLLSANTCMYNPVDSQEIDAPDLTIEVVNNLAKQEENSFSTRFKMVLDPKSQAAIRAIQQKRKGRQIIFPLTITPNTTGMFLHERFSLL